MTDLWLLRHGQTDWNVEGRWQGQAPQAPGLNDAGQAQAVAAQKLMRTVPLRAIYCSDLIRARQTSEIVAASFDLTICADARLREIHLGAWEGMLHSEIADRYPLELAERERDPLEARAPGGEIPAQVEQRVLSAVDDIAAKYPEDSVLIVSHGVALAIIICRARSIPMAELYEHIPENAKPYRVSWNSKG